MSGVKRIVLILLFGGLIFSIYKLSDYISFHNVAFSKKGIYIGRVNINLNCVKVGIFNLNLNSKNISIGVISVDINKTSPRGVQELSQITWKEIKDYIFQALKLIRKIPFSVKVKDIYLNVNNQYSINIYNFSYKNRKLNSTFFEFFNPELPDIYLNNVGINLKNIKNIKGYLTLKVSQIFSHINIRLKDKTFLKLKSSGKIGNANFKVKLSLSLEKKLKGFGYFSLPKREIKTNLKIEAPSPIYWKLSGNLEYTNKFSAVNRITIYPGKIKIKGFAKFCKQIIPFNVNLHNNYLYFSLSNINNLIYLFGFLNIHKKKVIIFGTDNYKGFLNLKGNFKKIYLLVSNFNIKNICNISINNLSLNGYISKSKWKFYGSFKSVDFNKKITLNNIRFNIYKNSLLTLLLKKNLKGLLIWKHKQYWGYLFGKIKVFGKKVKFNIPLIEGYLGKDFPFRICLKQLSIDRYLSVLNTLISGKKIKKQIYITLNGESNGNIFFNLKTFQYKAKFNIPLLFLQKYYILSFRGKGNKNRGLVKVKLNSYNLHLSYNRDTINYRLYTEFIRSQGKILINKDIISFTTINSLDNNPLNINAIIPIIGNINLSKNFQAKAILLPFCVYLTGNKLTCIKKSLLTYQKNKLTFSLETIKAFPLFTKLDFIFNKSNLYLLLKLKLKTEILNNFLSNYGTFILSPSEFKTELTYKGKIQNFFKNLYWSYSQNIKLLSTYLYKPISIYVSLLYKEKNLNGFIGFLNSLNQTPLGEIEFFYKFKKGFDLNYNFQDFPIKPFIPHIANGFLKITAQGKLKIKNNKKFLTGNLGIGGYIKILSYNFPGNKSSKKTIKEQNQKSKLNYTINVFSIEPLLVNFPNGKLSLTLNGLLKNRGNLLNIFINYGKVKLLNKDFNIINGKILIKKKTYINLLASHIKNNRLIFLKIFGYLPVNNLKFDIYSVPPLPRDELLAYLLAGAGNTGIANLPFAELIEKEGYTQLGNLFNKLSSSLISGVNIQFVPTFDPKEGFLFGIDIEKKFSNSLAVGYHWLPSNNPKATYLWGSLRFLFNTYLRMQRFSDGSNALIVRFFKDFGIPFK